MATYAVLSLVSAASPNLEVLIVLRALQGASGAAAAVFAPGMLRSLYGDARAVGAIGLLGSIEALAPALAPIVGLWLLHAFGWRASFLSIAVVAAGLAITVLLLSGRLLPAVSPRPLGGYGRLLWHGPFLRQALSHALTLGALLVIVFAAPTVFVNALGGTLTDFIALQVLGVASFAVAANITGRLVARYDADRLILGGTVLAAIGVLAILVYGLGGGRSIPPVIAMFLAVNIGLGLRGPPGFHAAIVAAGDDARGAAVLVLAILLITSLGTAAVAPFLVDYGIVASGAGAALLACGAVLILLSGRTRA